MSTIKVDTIQDTSGNEQFTAKAWVNFNGTGTVAIRDSGNVSSITDNGTGDYTVNFSAALASANYATVVAAADTGTSFTWLRNVLTSVPTTSASRIGFNSNTAALVDRAYISATFHG